ETSISDIVVSLVTAAGSVQRISDHDGQVVFILAIVKHQLVPFLAQLTQRKGLLQRYKFQDTHQAILVELVDRKARWNRYRNGRQWVQSLMLGKAHGQRSGEDWNGERCVKWLPNRSELFQRNYRANCYRKTAAHTLNTSATAPQ